MVIFTTIGKVYLSWARNFKLYSNLYYREKLMPERTISLASEERER